jgi:predicted DNA-binding protein (MmcQ/YjbR family)
MFALSQLNADPLRVGLKCEPQLAEALRGAHAAVLPGYHLNKRAHKRALRADAAAS